MLDGIFGSPGMVSMEQTLHLLDARRDAIASNLANVDTPGYRPVDATFAQTFGGALALGQGRSETTPVGAEGDGGAAITPLDAAGGAGSPVQAASEVALVPESAGAMRLDGSGVDVDAEMARLSETVLWYAAVSRQLSLGFNRLQTAIQGGGQ